MNKYDILRNRTSKRRRIYKHLNDDEFSSVPITLEIFPTNKCNTSCKFCAFSNIKKGEEISQDRFQKLIEDIIKLNIKAVVLSGGGEPLIYPNIHKYINQLTLNGVNVGVITNGLYINDELEQALLNCSWVRFSLLASNREDFCKLTDTSKSNFDLICSNIKRVTRLANRFENVIFSATFMANNHERFFDQAFEFIDLSSELSLNQIFFTRNVNGFKPESSDMQKIILVSDDIINYASEKRIVTNLKKFISNETSDYTTRCYNEKCNLINMNAVAVISADGSYYPCLYQYVHNGISFGNIHRDSLEYINSIQNRLPKLMQIEKQECSFCRHWSTRQELDEYKSTFIIKECKDPHFNFI